jgi:hypothetical protein
VALEHCGQHETYGLVMSDGFPGRGMTGRYKLLRQLCVQDAIRYVVGQTRCSDSGLTYTPSRQCTHLIKPSIEQNHQRLPSTPQQTAKTLERVDTNNLTLMSSLLSVAIAVVC